jgi:hypothetical protein
MLSEHKLSYDTINLEVLRQTMRIELDMLGVMHADVNIMRDRLDTYVMHITRRIATEKLEIVEIEATATVRYPATWWQHLKERWYPKWMRTKFPVQYTISTETNKSKVEARSFYPKVSLPDHAHYVSLVKLNENSVKNWY